MNTEIITISKLEDLLKFIEKYKTKTSQKTIKSITGSIIIKKGEN